MSLAQTYWQEIIGRPTDEREAFILALRGSAEDTWRDYKQSATTDGEPTEDDKKNLLKALSGFANSDGGIIVWGVECTKNADGEDVVDGFPCIANVEKFCNRLRAFEPELCDPPVKGVQHIVVEKSGSSNKGFVITYIPATEEGLHQGNRKGIRTFFYRASSTFNPMPTYMVAERFGRRPHPALELEIELEWPSDEARLTFVLENKGRGIAKYVGFTCKIFSKDVRIGHTNQVRNETSTNNDVPTVSLNLTKNVIHPLGPQCHVGSVTLQGYKEGNWLVVQSQVFCENMAPKTNMRVIAGNPTPEELIEIMTR